MFPTLFLSAAVFAVAAWTDPAEASAKATVRGLDAAALFPSSTLILTSFDGGPCREHGKELGLSRIWRSEEMQDFAGPLAVAAEGGKEILNAASHLPFDIEEAADLVLGGRTLFGLTKVETETVDKGDFHEKFTTVDFMLALNFKNGRQAAVKKILGGIETKIVEDMSGPPSVDVDVAGMKGKKISFQKGERYQPFSKVTYLVVDDWFLAATNEAQLAEAVTRLKAGDSKGSLLDSDVYKKCAKETQRPKTVFSLYVGLKDGLARIEKIEHGKEVVDQLRKSGIDKLNAVALGSELDGLSIRDRFYIHGYDQSLVVAKPELEKLHAMIPKGASVVATTAIDLGRQFDFILAAIAADTGDVAKKEIAKFEQKNKVNVREDLIGAFGPEFGFYAMMPKHGLIPDVGWLMRTKDVAKASAAVDKLLAVAGIDLTGQTKHRGMTIRYLNLTEEQLHLKNVEINPRPTYVFIDDYLLITPWPQAAKNFIDAMAKKDGGFAAREDVAAALARFRADVPSSGSHGVMYVDVPSIAGFVLDMAAPALQSAIPAGKVPYVDFAKFPSTEVFTSNLSPIFAATTLDGEGASSQCISPTGMASSYFVLSAAVGVWAARRYDAAQMPSGETEVIKVKRDKKDPAKKDAKVKKDDDKDDDDDDDK